MQFCSRGATVVLCERGTKCHLSPSSRLATTDIGRKLGRCAPLGEGELGSHLTVLPRLRPTSVPSGILMHTAL